MAARKTTKSKTKTTRKASPKKSTQNMDVKNMDMDVTESKMNKKPNNKVFKLVLVVLILAGLAWLTKSWWLAATVNNKPIWRVQVVKQLEKQGGAGALDELVTREIILQEASKNNIVVTEDDINTEIDGFKKNLEDNGMSLETALSQQGMTEEELRTNIKFQKIIEKLLSDKVTVTDDEAMEYYDTNKSYFGEDETFDSVKDQLLSQLKQQKLSTEFQTWIADLKTKSSVKTYVNY